MKQLPALQYADRRSNTSAGTSGAVGLKSPATIFWIALHCLCCLISLILGFRFSRLIFFPLFSSDSPQTTPFLNTENDVVTGTLSTAPASRVMVGRHGIRIRQFPHPNHEEVMRAHRIMERVQLEQRVQFGVKNPRSLIVVTTTYARTFQALHLTGLMHSLMNVPYDVVWVVVEAGGATNETLSLLGKCGIRSIHIGFKEKMGITWGQRYELEDQMRVHALRVVRDRKLDGIVMFADDSNMHSSELFDEVQKVNWFGAFSMGILVHTNDADEPLSIEKSKNEDDLLPVQGPMCDSSDRLVGWRSFSTMPYAKRSATLIGDTGVVLPRKVEWAGFVLNSRLLWKNNAEEKPDWVKDLDALREEDVDSPLSLVKDQSMVEPLGNCGRKVMVWWVRVEARADGKFPSGWIIDQPLEITAPAKLTPWPDSPPELPLDITTTTTTKAHLIEGRLEKRPPNSRSSRKQSSRSKKKRDATVLTNTLVSSRRPGEK